MLELMFAPYAGLQGAAGGLRSNVTPESRSNMFARRTGLCLPEKKIGCRPHE